MRNIKKGKSEILFSSFKNEIDWQNYEIKMNHDTNSEIVESTGIKFVHAQHLRKMIWKKNIFVSEKQ